MRERLVERLRALRTERGWSQEELAGRAGIAPQSLSNIETLRSSPTIETLEALAAALGVPLVALLESKPPDDIEHLHQRARYALATLSPDHLRVAIAVLETLASNLNADKAKARSRT
jgi:transcriptional regulator with XRE-family HTH domain